MVITRLFADNRLDHSLIFCWDRHFCIEVETDSTDLPMGSGSGLIEARQGALALVVVATKN